MTDKEKKKCKYMISILGEQILDDESDRIEVLTEGNFLMKKDHCYIGYKEYDEDAPQSFYDNLIKVQDNTVTITRKGPMRSQLMLEKGRRHQCTKNGGTLEVSYTLDFNNDLVSENKFKITVEEKEKFENEVD